ncbi:DUF3667 domain-containing protein [Stenotrophomonas sp.]|nr:DUF3667 domain-containing protein [Stenotrophomonas sp.]
MGMHVDASCINCGRAVGGADQKFCPGCGQPTPVHRIDWHFLGHELEHSVLHMDRGILYSLKQLMLQPGKLLRDYIEGRRGNQVKPVLLITMTAAAVLLLNRLITGAGVMDSAAMDALGAGPGVPPELAKLAASFRSVNAWIESHFAVFTLMLLPLEALIFRVVFSRFGKLNYPEWLVITTLLTVQVFVVWSLLVLVHRWLPQTQVLAALLGSAYSVVSLVQFFEGRPIWSTLWRALLALGTFSVLSTMATVVAVIVVLLIH